MVRPNRWLILFAAIIGIGVLGLAGIWPLRKWVRALTVPITRDLSSIAGFSATRERGDDRIRELEARLNSLAVDYVRLKALEEENRSLRAQAKFLEASGYDSVGARVIGRDIQGQRSLFIIDRGSLDNVEIGQAVITDQGIFIGKISVIRDRIATVELLTDPTSRVAAALADKGGLSGVLEGRGNGAAALTYVQNNKNLKRDMVVVTAGTEEKVPGHLPLGVINSIEGKPSDPFLTASVEPLAPIERIVFVSVLRPSVLRPGL